MLITAAIILLALWYFGFVIFPVLGWFIHLLLVLALIMVLMRVIAGENPFK